MVDMNPACTSTQCSFTPPVNLENLTYTWKIQSYGPGGYGLWSGARTFKVNVPVPQQTRMIYPTSPASATPTYVWQMTAYTTWYYLWVEGPSGTVIKTWYDASVCSGNVCSVTPSVVLPNGTYTVWVQTKGAGGYGPWSNAVTFTVTGSTAVPANMSSVPATPTPEPTFVPK
jgi:large repetitive protein